MTDTRRPPARAALLVVVMLLAAGCSIDASKGLPPITNGQAIGFYQPPPLPYSGPTGRSHWHSAIAIRVCNEVIAPLADVANTTGIHSHGDGLIHIHPGSGSGATFRDATIGKFFDTVGIKVSESDGVVTITVPGYEPLTNGDPCGVEVGRWALHRWAGPSSPSPWEEITGGLANARLITDGELFTLSFVSEGTPFTKPPSIEALVASSPALSQPPPEPFVVLPDTLDASNFAMWTISTSAAAPAGGLCEDGWVVSGDGTFCYERPATQLKADQVVDASAWTVGRQPGVILEFSSGSLAEINRELIEAEPNGGRNIALELDGTVHLVALAPGPFADNLITLAGGMSADTASTLADLLQP